MAKEDMREVGAREDGSVCSPVETLYGKAERRRFPFHSFTLNDKLASTKMKICN